MGKIPVTIALNEGWERWVILIRVYDEIERTPK